MSKLAVVAFGGNALIRGEQKGTIDEQETNVYDTCSKIFELIRKDYNLVITHGNGPQVGNVLLQHEAGESVYGIPKMPMDFCVAETQGSIGYMIEQQLRNVLEKNNKYRDIITIITQVVVDKNDPAFQNPTKPVGPFYPKEEADKLANTNNWVFKEDPRKRGWRRVVASPKPKSINNCKSIETLARSGQIVIAVGGGGIPVFYVEPNKLQGIDAVIDKDLASALLASQIKADYFFILTDVPKACINFHTPEEKKLDVITVSEAYKYLNEGHFAEGSMAPKIRAAIYFVENGGQETIITTAAELHKDNCGTKIIKG
ncbi:MAG TPA: carbamate kinase [Bacteroidales bacterium]|nr:carbamate kinase [Bacteroidales bacterium]